MTGPMVRAHDVFCLYPTPRGHVAALRGLTVDVAAGERVVVYGPNGAGKTTLMRVLIGELAPSAGMVDVCGVDLIGAGEGDRTRLRRRSVGLIDQHHGRSLRPEISVLDNVALQVRLAGVGRRPARQRAQALLDGLGLGRLAGRRPDTLSGGEAQRVAVCAAVAHTPRLILADEPTGELDRASADAVYDLLVAVAEASGAALLVVSHDPHAVRIADRIVRIRDGRLSEEWTAQGTETLVVDDRGWVRLPEPLRRSTGLVARVQAIADGSAIVLTPPAGSAPAAPVPVPRPVPAVPVPVPQPVPAPRPGGLWPDTTESAGEQVAALRDVAVERDGRTVLERVDLDLHAATLSVVQGRSGSGKTTLLRVLAGLERPDHGVVRVAGIDLTDLDRAGLAELRRRHIAVAGQSVALLDTMDIGENIDLVRVARGMPVDPDRVEEWIVALGLAAVRGRPVRVLSGGERQRVAVARVLAAEPRIAILDEPTSRQDEAHAELVTAALVAAARRGVAVVAASHDPVLTAAADTILDLDATCLAAA
ncbi:MAG: peptide/nickel transport system ATP-binding protein ddpF [Micromonosporaceae bacterium]|jgi:ABC-type lipoprotein export system ATPase subunit|nr:peptide/nickel transport system ATP-binding protein ddpF [Micromonosporaceae bacterium]